MTPKAPIWWESTKNVSREPFQYKRVTPASLGQKNFFRKNFFWARWRRAPQGALTAFSPHYIFLYMSVTPLTKNWGPGAPRPHSALIFQKHVILAHFGPKWGPGGAAKGFGPNFFHEWVKYKSEVFINQISCRYLY